MAHIQETHWSFSSTWSTDSFHCIHSGATKKGTAGVLTLVRKDLCKSTQIKFQHVVPGRLLLVRFPMGQTFLNLINVYQIFVQHPDKEDSLQFQRSQLLHHLDCLIQSIPRSPSSPHIWGLQWKIATHWVPGWEGGGPELRARRRGAACSNRMSMTYAL